MIYNSSLCFSHLPYEWMLLWSIIFLWRRITHKWVSVGKQLNLIKKVNKNWHNNYIWTLPSNSYSLKPPHKINPPYLKIIVRIENKRVITIIIHSLVVSVRYSSYKVIIMKTSIYLKILRNLRKSGETRSLCRL